MTIIRQKTQKSKIKFHDNLGYLPERIYQKRYMHIYHIHNDFEPIQSSSMDGFRIKIRVKIKIKGLGKFISGIAKVIANIASPLLKVVKGVGSFTEDVYSAAKNVALSVLPPDIRRFVSDGILNIEQVVTNPVATVQKIVGSVGDVASNIVRETTNAVEYTYKNVARPAFRVVRNVANETVWKPIHKVVDVAILPILPKDIRDKLDEILDIPEKTFSGKLTDKEILEGCKAYIQLAMIPAKETGKFDNAIINALKKDAILGPFITTIDKYSGGLLTSAQNLASTPEDIYKDRQIDWKARIIDALKIYLTVVTAGTVGAALANIAKGMAINYIGEETGLDGTVLGRTALSAGVLYASALDYKDLTKFAESATLDTAKDAAKSAAIREAKSESVKEAVKKGWVDDAFTAKMILSAGGKFYDAAGTDKTLMDTMSEIHDKEFQNYVDYLVKKETGLPLTYAHLVDIYNTDWAKLASQVSDSMSKISLGTGSSDESFLARMGQNFIDEIKRVPGNFQNIGSNVLDELSRTPENMAKFAKAVAAEANRTPENIANIANNIARESAVGASNVVDEAVRTQDNVAEAVTNVGRETVKAVDNIADELDRTPENVSQITDNVVKAGDKALDDIANEATRTPGNVADAIANTDWDSLIQKYGKQIIPFLQARYQGFSMRFPPTEGMLNDIELQYGKKKSNTGLMVAGLAIVAAMATYVATDE